jgi:hypothetical protein
MSVTSRIETELCLTEDVLAQVGLRALECHHRAGELERRRDELTDHGPSRAREELRVAASSLHEELVVLHGAASVARQLLDLRAEELDRVTSTIASDRSHQAEAGPPPPTGAAAATATA